MTKQITEYDYQQVKIIIKLATTSPLHCGDGDTLPAAEWQSAKEKKEGTINTVCKDKSQQAYIPAPTIRGSLRDRCQTADKEILFGCSHGEGAMGKVRIYDAICIKTVEDSNDQYQNTNSKTTLRDGVAINPITQTAKEHCLFVHEIVPIGTQFQLTLEADRITQEQLDNLIALLKQWNGGMQSALGKGRSKGWGQLQLKDEITIKTLSKQAIKDWIDSESSDPQWQDQTLAIDESTPPSTAIKFYLHPQSPLLINDHARVEEKTPSNEHPADQQFMRTKDGKAFIPGSSLKGAVRSHAHRIMASIAHLHYGVEATIAAQCVESGINQIFGAERQRSLLWMEDALDQVEGSSKKHTQFFNAVDRFTGGVSDGALFNVVAANCEQLSGKCYFDQNPKRQPIGDWWKGLLLLVVRDFMEDDFAIGWGKGKGYGRAKLSLEIETKEYTNFDELLKSLESYQPEKWIEQLHEHIKQCIKDSQRGERT